MKYPKVYYQIKKLKSFWEKSSSPSKDTWIAAFNETLQEIEAQVNSELDTLECWELVQ